MWSELKARNGIDRHDRSTWRRPVSGLNRSAAHEVYAGIAGERLCATADQLLGVGNWRVPRSWGGFLITFPSGYTLHDWPLSSKNWHWDGKPSDHQRGMRSLFVFTLFSRIQHGGGGTLLLQGSHRLIDRFCSISKNDNKPITRERFLLTHPWLAELAGLTTGAQGSPQRIERFMKEGAVIDSISVRVAEITGEPGDAVICHPSILHAASPNHRDTPRFMRVKGLERFD